MKRSKRWGIRAVLALGVVTSGAAPGWGQTVKIWEAAVSDNFGVATRWNPDGKPVGTDTGRFEVAGSYTVSFTANESFGALQVNGGNVFWNSAATRLVDVTSIAVNNIGTDLFVQGDVRINNSGGTTINTSTGAGAMTISGGRLTTSSLQVTQGNLNSNNANSVVIVTGASNIGGQNEDASVTLTVGSTTFLQGNVNLAPAGSGSSSIGRLTLNSGATLTIDGNLAVGNISDDNRQGIVNISGTNSAITQTGIRSVTLGRILVGTPSGDDSSRITVSSGGTFTSGTGAITLNNLGHINVGASGTFNANGAMTINDGGQLNVTGGSFNSIANVTVNSGGEINFNTGTFSRSAASNLVINGGSYTQMGTSTHSIANGADTTVQNAGSYSSTSSFALPATSQLVVTGAGSTFQSADLTSVGGTGTTITVSSGGVLTTDFLNLGTTNPVSVNVTGANSRLSALGSASEMARGAITVGTGGLLELHSLQIGQAAASSSLQVQAGGTATVQDLFIGSGNNATNNGTVTVTGSGVMTQQGAANLVIGGNTAGTGSLTLGTIGGLFTTGTGTAQVNAFGAINVNALATFNNRSQMTVDGGLINASAGTFTMQAGSSLSILNNGLAHFGNQVLTNGTNIIVDNAELRLANLTPQGGTINFLGGLVNFTQSTSFTGGKLTALLGSTPALLPGRTLLVQGTATLQSQMILDGGVFTTNALSGGTLLDHRRGTLNLTGSNLVVGSGGTFGSTLSLPTSAIVNVQGSTASTIDAGALVYLPGGQLNTTAALTNNGEIQMDHPQARAGGAGTLTNNGTIVGTGRIEKPLVNNASGRVQANGSDRLVFQGSSNSNAGLISATNGGQIEFTQPVTNATSTGLIAGQGGVLRFNGGLTNNGSMTFTSGNMDVFGDITQNPGGRITISGGGTTSFYDDVNIAPGAASVQASTVGGVTTRVVFFGSYNGGVSGGGAAFIEGDHRPGNSPGLVTFAGDVFYGNLSKLVVELGGTQRGTQYDAIDVTGSVTVNGTLEVAIINSYLPLGGEQFLLISNDGSDAVQGTFSGLPEAAFLTAGDRLFQITYQGGSGSNDVMLLAVPEPSTWALIGMTAIGSGLVYWRRKNKTGLDESVTLS